MNWKLSQNLTFLEKAGRTGNIWVNWKKLEKIVYSIHIEKLLTLTRIHGIINYKLKRGKFGSEQMPQKISLKKLKIPLDKLQNIWYN